MVLNILYFLLFFIRLNFFTIRKFGGTSLKDCQIKFHDKDWYNIDDCDSNNINEWWTGATYELFNLSIEYNLGDRINVWIKVFNKLPYHSSPMNIDNYEDFCSIYFHLYLNEYYINNQLDYIYYCYDCDCTTSLGEKTFCHKWNDKRLYCKPHRGKIYNFFIMINGYNELDLMKVSLDDRNYYKLIGNDFYLSENDERVYIKFSSDSVLIVNYNKRIKVNLDELSIKYSYEGNGDFYTINGQKLEKSGIIGSDIYFQRPNSTLGDILHNVTLIVQTIAKFGEEKGKSTSEEAKFNFYYCSEGYKMFENSSCFMCFESCSKCSNPGNDKIHNCEECDINYPYYFFQNSTKNCYNSCKSANKIKIKKYSFECIDKEKCTKYIDSKEESCINNCTEENEYFYNNKGIILKKCVNNCEKWISSDNTTCTDSCQSIKELSDLTSTSCVKECPSNLFYTPELMSCGNKCNYQYPYYIDYKNNTKKCVKKCDEGNYFVIDEETLECLPFYKFEIMSIQINPNFYSEEKEVQIYVIREKIKNATIKINFNQNIKNRINMLNGSYERDSDDNKTIIIKIEELKENQKFIFKDSVDDTYSFGFQIEIINENQNLFFFILFCIFGITIFILIILLIICYRRNKSIKKNNSFGSFGITEK